MNIIIIWSKPVKKNLIFDSKEYPELPPKIEGFTINRKEKQIIFINDNDFGINGEKTYIISIPMENIGEVFK